LKNLKTYQLFEALDEEDLMTLADEVSQTEAYVEFRKHHTKAIREYLNDDKFNMTHQLAGVLVMDIAALIEKAGYKITKA